MRVESTPKVSVCVVTYNQEKYIAQCLQSLVDQITNFTFEILVADDCSTDGTREIIHDFADRYPGLFRIFLHKKNIGAYENFRFIHAQAASEYIAHMDGDDYALPGKLHAQADLLDSDPSCHLAWTPIFIQNSEGLLYEQNEGFKKNALSKRYSQGDLIKYGTIGSNSSKMYRRGCAKAFELKTNFEKIDYFVNAIDLGDGFARFTETAPLGVYRKSIGIASSGDKTKLLTLHSVNYFFDSLPHCKLECNTIALIMLISGIKNKRLYSWLALKIYIRTFTWKTFFVFYEELKFIRLLHLKGKYD